MINSRFAVASHILTMLAQYHEESLTSERIADSVNTNPVVVRRVLGLLRNAGMVTSQGGNGGGWRLVGDPEGITLRDVYRAVEDMTLFSLHHRAPNPDCMVGRHIQHALTRHFTAATQAMEEELACTTVADILREVQVGVG